MDINVLQAIKTSFLKELEISASGQKTSLPFIKHTLSDKKLVQDGQVFQVFVIGGSMFKKAMVKKDGNHFTILAREEKTQTPYKTEEDFLSFIKSELDNDINTLAINFAYPLSPVLRENLLDGTLIKGMKENKFDGLVGKQVGKTIEEFCKKKLSRNINVTVANDTVCTLLAGYSKIEWEKLACGIVGTGINFAFFLDQHTLVNLESANFDKFTPTEEGKEIDKESANPGDAIIEKATAGAYLYKHFNLAIKKRGIDFPAISSTFELKQIIERSIPMVSDIALGIFDYSASLVACEIGGIMAFKKQSMQFVAEGSLLWEPLYGNLLDAHLIKLVPEYTAIFLRIRESSIMGAAKLVG